MPHSGLRHLPRARLLFGALGAVLLASLALLLARTAVSGATSSHSITDKHLILHPRQTKIRAVLANGAIMSGSLWPTIPGKNTVHLVFRPSSVNAHAPAVITLRATMLAMYMPPVRAVLVRAGHGYVGAITLPMFGAYRVSITLRTTLKTTQATLTIAVPLPHL